MARRPVFFDFETTGTFVERDRIIEFAAYDRDLNRSFQRLIHPGMPIPKESSTIHGITDDMVKDAENFATVMQEFFEFCHGDVLLIAHNADNFDLPFLRAECKRNNISIPDHWYFLDSLKWARKYRKELPRHSLQYLRVMYGIKENQAHRALDDSLILSQVFSLMTDDLTMEQVISCLGDEHVQREISPIAKPTNQTLQLFT